MKNKLPLFFAALMLLNLSCNNSNKTLQNENHDSVIATIDNEPVTVDEIEANYYRNQNSSEIDSTSLEDFYPSYINYRLKLYEGYQQGYHKDSAIVAEFNEYASEIANRYWIENEIRNARIETFKNRFQSELKAFHILKSIPNDALPVDTAQVYNTLVSVRDSLLNGANPQEMNEKHSSNQDGRSMGGQLSWITAGSTIKPFEDVVYALEPDEISYPVRTQFGYHLILLQEKRPRTPARQVSHIYVTKDEDGSGRVKIDKAYQALEADSSWSDVVQNYTEDTTSKNRDGQLGWVSYGSRFPAELMDLVIQTDPGVAYSEPYEASYGYQILKVDSIRTFQDEEQKEEFIIQRLEGLGRLNVDQDDIYNRIASESDLTIYQDNFSKILRAESTQLDSIQTMPDMSLINFNGKTYDTSDFQKWLNNVVTVDEVMQSENLIESYRDYIIQNNLVQYTRENIPEFANQVEHFLEGLIVFKISEDNIWETDSIDNAELREYYESNQQKYVKGKTFYYTEISAPSDSLMQNVLEELSKGVQKDQIEDQFENVVFQDDSTSNTQASVYTILEKLEPGAISEPTSGNGSVYLYILNDINEARRLSFEEAYNQVTTDFLPIREENYINHLKKKYDVQLYPENLN